MNVCDICGSPATTTDGIVGAYLCDSVACLDRAYSEALPAFRQQEEA